MLMTIIFRQIHRVARFLLLTLSLSLLIIACQKSSVEQPTATAPTTTASDCRSIEHEMGVTEVCGQPEKVAALTPHILDSILSLGVQPAAYAEVADFKIQTYDNPTEQIPYIGQWVTTKPIGLGDRSSPSLERLTQLQPDLILGADWQRDKYSLLSQIAPTLLFSDEKDPNKIQSWEQDIEGIAQALGREAQAKKLLTAHDEQIAQVREALQPVLQVYPRVFVLGFNSGATQIASEPESTIGRLLQEIGFEIVRPSGFLDDRAAISFEVIPQIETDLIIVLSWDDNLSLNPEQAMPEVAMQQKWAQNPLLNSMSIFQQGRVFFVDNYLWSGVIRGPLSDKLILEALPDLLRTSVDEEKN